MRKRERSSKVVLLVVCVVRRIRETIMMITYSLSFSTLGAGDYIYVRSVLWLNLKSVDVDVAMWLFVCAQRTLSDLYYCNGQ